MLSKDTVYWGVRRPAPDGSAEPGAVVVLVGLETRPAETLDLNIPRGIFIQKNIKRVLRPEPSQRLYNHSPDGFEWGYGGSGPAQLALAILYDFTEDRRVALQWYQDFKREHVAGWPPFSWTLDGETIVDWLLQKVGRLD